MNDRKRRSSPTWEIKKGFLRKGTIQTSLADILEQKRTPWEHSVWLSALRTVGKHGPILQTRSLKLQKTVQLGQGHLAGGTSFFQFTDFLAHPHSREAVPSNCANKVNNTQEILQDPRFIEIISNPCSVKESTSPLGCLPITSQKLLQSNAFICFSFLNLFQAPHFPGTSAVIYDTAANTLHL